MSVLIADKNYIAAHSGGLQTDIEAYPEGIVLPIDKPYRWTSADVIRKIKFAACRHFGKKNLKVGHAGTLDPLATGVLLVCIGKATKLAEAFQKHDKEYIAGISFGATTPSYDLEKEIDRFFQYEHITEQSLKEAVKAFIGEQEQIAPLFSAKSVDGVRAYEMARKIYRTSKAAGSGERLDAQAESLLTRQWINIYDTELLRFCPEGLAPSLPDSEDAGDNNISRNSILEDNNARNSRIKVNDNSSLHLPHADIRIACTKGTYIRAFARDLGEALGSGAHLDALCRTKTGNFSVADSITVSQALSLFLRA